jgi:hypothetical protein
MRLRAPSVWGRASADPLVDVEGQVFWKRQPEVLQR